MTSKSHRSRAAADLLGARSRRGDPAGAAPRRSLIDSHVGPITASNAPQERSLLLDDLMEALTRVDCVDISKDLFRAEVAS